MKHIYYNFQVLNDTTSDMLCQGLDRRLYPILNKASDYSMSILKLSLPAEQIESFNNTNINDYKIRIGSLKAKADNTGLPEYVIEKYGEASLPLSTAYKYHNQSDLIEAFNRTSLQVYRNYLSSLDYEYGNLSTYTISAQQFINGGVPSSNSYIIKTFAMPSKGTSQLGYVKLKLSFGDPDSELASDDNTGSLHPISVSLVSPNNQRVLIFSNRIGDINQELIFEDGCYVNQDTLTDVLAVMPAGTYQPKESFTKFNTGQNQSGNWQLIIDSNSYKTGQGHECHIKMGFELQCLFLPQKDDCNLKAMQTAPALNIDTTENKLELILHETMYLGGEYLQVSPALYELLGFDGTFNPATSLYRIKTPQVLLSTTFDKYVNYIQPISSIYKLNQIRQIQIKSQNLPVSGEQDIHSSENIVMSLDINTNTLKDRYEFSAQGNERYYDMFSDISLSEINLSVWILYENGTSKMASIPPSTSFNCLIKFLRNDLVNN